MRKIEKDFLIEITSVQRNGEDKDEIKVKTRGTVKKINNKVYVAYNEYEGRYPCSCVIKAESDEKLCVIKNGSVSAKLILEKGKKHYCPYSTKEGTFVLGVFADDMRVKYDENSCDISLKYALDINSQLIGKNEISISAQKIEKEGENKVM